MAQDQLTAASGGPARSRAGQAGAALAGALLAGGAAAEAATGAGSLPLAALDFAAGASFAVTGMLLLRARGARGGWLALAVSAAWFAGTGSGAVALPGYAAGVAVLGYRAFLCHLLLPAPPGHQRRTAGTRRTVMAAGYACPLLPAAAGSFASATVMAVVTALTGLAARRAAADRRPALLAGAAAAATLAVTWWLAAAGLAAGDGLTVANDAALAAAAVAAGSRPQRWLPGAIHSLVVDLGPSRNPGQPVSDLLAAVLADPGLEVRYAVPGRGWVDEQGRPASPPPEAGPPASRVTRATAPGGGEVALLGGPTAEPASALSGAAARAAALALDNARITAEVREQAAAVRDSRQRLLTVADEERQALAARLRAGPGKILEQVAGQLAGLDGPDAGEIRGLLAGAVANLEQLALGLFPASLGSRPLGVLLAEVTGGVGLPVRLGVDGPVDALPPGLRALAYFFCSECLANVAKHACASAVTVRVSAGGGQLTLLVEDNGRGGAGLAGSRGLRGLADRVEVAGGTLAVDSPPGGPTRVSAQIPAGD